MSTHEDGKNGTVTGQSMADRTVSRASKTHQDYWKSRVVRRPFVTRDGKRGIPPDYSVRMRHLGQDVWFNLDTANVSVATVKARDIYLSLVASGWDATLARFKPDPMTKAEVCTVGEFLEDIRKSGPLKPVTVRRYAVKLRKIVSDVAKLEAGLKAKAKRQKYDYIAGGRAAWLARVERQPLDVLTSDAIVAWRNSYAAKAGADPVKRKSAERSAASCIRCARSLFTEDVLNCLKVKVPANPFTGVKLKDPGPARYHSDVNPEWLLRCARRELQRKEPNQYRALFLCLWAGLRRKEADLLLWTQVDFGQGRIDVRRTPYFEPKTEESQRTIDLSPKAMDALRRFKKNSVSEFVLDGREPNLTASYDYYRCDHTWRSLNSWLKSKGVRQTKAIHALRKESGSLIASTYGIEAARQHLGHRDIRTTSAHYVAKKKRIEIALSVRPSLEGVA